MPHAYCLREPALIWLHGSADILIAVAYLVIGLSLVYFVRRKREVGFSWIFVLFAGFSLLCGGTHLIAVWTLWHPVYRLEGLIKAMTAAASLTTAIMLVPLIPRVIALAGPEELRQLADDRIRRLNVDLERRVKQRTGELSTSTASLQAEVRGHESAEDQLRQSEQRYRSLFEDSPLPMAVFEAGSLAFLAVNTATENMYGYTASEFSAMTLRDTQPPNQLPAAMDFLLAVDPANPTSGSFVTKHKTGKLITIEARVRTIEFDGRRAVLSQMTDVTERKLLEAQLQQSQKMEAIGQLAGGMAHDFNNLLTIILGYSEGVLRKLKDDDPLRENISEIRAAGKRAAELIRQLLAFSRTQILRPQILQLNAIVSNVSVMLKRLLRADIEVSLELDPDLGQIRAEPAQLEQVLVNLAINARDSMPKGGRLVIETRNVALDADAAARKGIPPGRYVELLVTDTGCGMDDATRSRVFEPFFTTKGVGNGTGLGCSMVFGVMQQSGGAVTVSSEVEVGTTFKMYLPRLDLPVAKVPVELEKPYTQAANQGTTILLVEDEPSVRALAKKVLEEAGYGVLPAGNGIEALKIAVDVSRQPALLLTDVVMPEMNGLELAQELKKKWPSMPVVFASGYADQALLDRAAIPEDASFLQKPYSPELMLEQVAAALLPGPPSPSANGDGKQT
jgi:PAS domain S-box-containing protein